MNRLLLASLFFATTSLFATSGCAPSTDSAEAGSAAATSESPLPELARHAKAITMKENGESKIIGAPKKIEAVINALGSEPVAIGGAPRCGPPRFQLAIAGADNEELATVQAGCSKAFLHVGSDWFETSLAEDAIREAFAATPALGDILVAATEAHVSTSERPQSARQMKKGFDLDAVPAAREPSAVPRCAPLLTVRFTDGTKDIATVSVLCAAEQDAELAPAQVSVEGASIGWVDFNVEALFAGF